MFSAILAGLGSAGLLLLFEYFKKEMPGWVYAAGVNVFGVIFGLALVSFGWEFLVRREHGRELRHYLRLGGAVSASGLQDVQQTSALNWRELTRAANSITVLALDMQWFNANSYALLEIARRRALVIEYVVPGSSSGVLQRRAAAASKDPADLLDEYQKFADEGIAMWRGASDTGGALHAGSRLTFRIHDLPELNETFAIDDVTLVNLNASGSDASLRDRLTLVFEQDSKEFPTRFLRSYLSEVSTLTRIGTN